jgi:hypothetical protein
MEPVPDLLLLRKAGSAGNQTRTSGSVARETDPISKLLFLFFSKYRMTNKVKKNSVIPQNQTFH